jgi:hypothetical protein
MRSSIAAQTACIPKVGGCSPCLFWLGQHSLRRKMGSRHPKPQKKSHSKPSAKILVLGVSGSGKSTYVVIFPTLSLRFEMDHALL